MVEHLEQIKNILLAPWYAPGVTLEAAASR